METKASLLRTEIRVILAGQTLMAQWLEGVERLNSPTRLSVQVLSDGPYDLPESLGHLMDQPIRVELTGPGLPQPRRMHLNLDSADEQWLGKRYQLNLTACSKLERGRRQEQARLFMGMTREQVVWQLLWEMGYDRFEVDLALDPVPAFEGPFLQVQDETTLDCFQRLLAEVGANYWFEDREPEQNHELLVIRNDTQVSPYLPYIEWGQAVSGLSPDQQLNRITAAYQRWSDQPHIAGRSVQGTTPGAISREDADYRSFTPPRPRPEAEQRALFEQQYFDQQRYFITLHGHQPLLSAGHTVAFDAHQLPNDCPSGEYRMIQVVHNAEPAAGEGNAPGVQYRNTAVVIPRATPPRPKVKTQPPLPHLFPARIESRYDHAELSADGRYYFRADFDRSAQGKGQASPPTSRLTPYASPGTDDTEEIGWHFPLLDQSRALVTFLDDDPARPMIVGFVPGRSQFGPVTNKNATQSRIVTPGQNELTFDDAKKAACIALHTFDRQVRLELNAQDAEPYVHLMAIYGGVNLYADLNLMIEAEAQLEERIGADRTQTVKNNSLTTTEEGSIYHQAETDQTHTAQVNLTQSAGEDFSLWVQKHNLSILTNPGMNTSVTNGDLQLQVQAGAAIHQVNGNITVKGNGNGDILLKQGDGGVKIDPSGNIKLFGKKVTLNGQSGVVFDGEVQYETGAGNEPEEAEALNVDELPETTVLELQPVEVEGDEAAQYEAPKSTYWFELQLVDDIGNPVADEPYWIKAPDGVIHEGQTDQEGKAKIEGIGCSGQCEVRFPESNNAVMRRGSHAPVRSG
ncbi:contractile injection system protein, VgrG/Pvc8 family [Saccharospirillum salsuginis]|uniref:Type VI secretion protein Vgr n=1 Tax=Saccharospirillum salsuginis TaxID=418750 RepID=A0A918K058_9GAMM|nr:contractile injection system protein, VgrG/Pvc8 family [Saccharospirillum salsuginis]GGX39243.1 type VI secretion protein Vgr [Saccharospirillum salsuginis]